jgi:Glycosyl transferase family group 2
MGLSPAHETAMTASPAESGRPSADEGPGRIHQTRPYRPQLGSLCVLFFAACTLGLYLQSKSQSTGAIGWYATIVWTLPVSVAIVGLLGAVKIAAAQTRREERCVSVPSDLLVVVVPTVGRYDTMPALERAIGSFCEYLPAYFPRLRIDVVIEENCEALLAIKALAGRYPPTRIVNVPSQYQTLNGSRFKARANHYAHELRLIEGEATDHVWVLHMDDDTGVGEGTAEALASFIATQASLGQRPLHLAQGILTFPREYAPHRLTWLADAVRPGCDVTLFAASTGLGSPRAGLHGELLLVRASIEASIGWDFGPRSIVEDAEFALRFCEHFPHRSGWIAGRSYGASPATVGDFVRQRERWVWGLLELATKRAIPLRQRLVLLHNVALWAFGPLQHPAFVIVVGVMLGDLDTSPATVFLVPFWALNASYVVWLYCEGLRINSLSSASPHRRWREALALLLLFPLFSLWEAAGVWCGVVKFLRRSETRFAVIPKPL